MTNFEQVKKTLEQCLQELSSPDLATSVRDGTLAADLHAYYNKVGMKEGWLKPEYATPLSQQDATNQRKNVDAARDVVKYWLKHWQSEQMTRSARYVADDMAWTVLTHHVRDSPMEGAYAPHCIDRGYHHLDEAADSQHEQWKLFVKTYQSERVTPGNEKFREANYRQFMATYRELSEQEKDQDRLIVAVITDRILAKALPGCYKQTIDL